MAIDATRGLPSFAEMLNSFKNQQSLGSALQSGMEGYKSGLGMAAASKKAASEQSLEAAQAAKANAEAEALKTGANKKRVPLNALPESIKGQLASFVDADGMVPYEAAQVALGTTEQGRKTDQAANDLKLRQEAFEAQQKMAEENLTLKQQLQDALAQRAEQATELGAAGKLVEATSKQKSPSLLTRGVSAVKEGLGGDPLASIIAERQGEAAKKKLSEIANINPPMSREPVLQTPAPNIAPTRAPAKLPNYPTEQDAIRAGHKAGDRVMINGVTGTLQ